MVEIKLKHKLDAVTKHWALESQVGSTFRSLSTCDLTFVTSGGRAANNDHLLALTSLLSPKFLSNE